MANKFTIPYNDVFFYGISLRSRDVSDVKGDVFANILMKYLMSLKPVSNKLYRTTDNAKYEYSYTFIPSKPLSWRVIKNRRIIEDIEQLSDGKYCLNYYDDHGKDVKRIIFNPRNRWVKTNYYNSIYGDNLICSLVPKELNGETVILQYNTGDIYPVTLYCCSVASCAEVLHKVLARVPEPEVMALTNYGILYFACEETRNIYEQILKEEEEKYTLEHQPAVFNTKEDVANGFCFNAESFDSTKTSDSFIDLNMAQELTDEGFSEQLADADYIDSSDLVEDFSDNADVDEEILSFEEPESQEDDVYSIDEQIAAAIKLISETTSISIDESIVFPAPEPESTDVESETDEIIDLSSNIIESEIVTDESQILADNAVVPEQTEETNSDETSVSIVAPHMSEADDLLSMDDEAIDDYVSTLIDSLISDARSTAADYLIEEEEVFVSLDTEITVPDDVCESKTSEDFVSENIPDATIDSNGVSYFYYGDTDDSGNRSGRGKTLMSNGQTAYEGEYQDDARNGKGAFYYKDGSLCYWGDWMKNLRHGFGLGVSSETGIIHAGNWSNNKPEGVGVRYDASGIFMYIDSACDRTNGGIRITNFTDNSFTVEVWDEKTLKVVKKVISLDDLLK